jgi:hypothetical protein
MKPFGLMTHSVLPERSLYSLILDGLGTKHVNIQYLGNKEGGKWWNIVIKALGIY